ncbi:hypothetical protein GCM10028778_22830 [Barrientosiimonas marina]
MKFAHVITNNEIKSWNNGDIITIKAGTGAGKSYFIKNDLYDYAKNNDKNILMLVSRKQIINNFKKDIEGKTNIDIDTYQKLEQSIVHDIDYDLSKYDYIVCDEFHYFLNDDFNKWIDLSFDKIMNSTNNIKIFMSATGDSVVRYFSENHVNTKNYSLPFNFDKIRNLRFFYKENTIEGFIEKAINNNQKAIFFVESAEKACELHRKYPNHTMFNCSESSKYYKYVNKKKIKDMLDNNKFDDLILITTRVIDTGINIEDPELHKVVIDVVSASNIIQCLGRKRFTDDQDYIDVYIKSRNKKSIESYRRNVENAKNKMDILDFNGDHAYLDRFYRDDIDGTMIYTEWDEQANAPVHKIHKLNYFKNKLDREELSEMMEYGYNYYISTVLDRTGDYVVRA